MGKILESVHNDNENIHGYRLSMNTSLTKVNMTDLVEAEFGILILYWNLIGCGSVPNVVSNHLLT